VLPDGERYDPAVFVSMILNWEVDEVITLGDGAQIRMLAIQTEIADELVERGFSGVFTIEPFLN
jgi:hypothetical protein